MRNTIPLFLRLIATREEVAFGHCSRISHSSSKCDDSWIRFKFVALAPSNCHIMTCLLPHGGQLKYSPKYIFRIPPQGSTTSATLRRKIFKTLHVPHDCCTAERDRPENSGGFLGLFAEYCIGLSKLRPAQYCAVNNNMLASLSPNLAHRGVTIFAEVEGAQASY